MDDVLPLNEWLAKIKCVPGQILYTRDDDGVEVVCTSQGDGVWTVEPLG